MMTRSSLSGARIGLLRFPGSNCDADCIDTFKHYYQTDLIPIWHESESLPDVQGLIIPGGFSYGDYLRSGCLASHSHIMKHVKEFASQGGSIIGICNGFQILTESHLLPGMLLKNDSQKFVCEFADLDVASGTSAYHLSLSKEVLSIPVAHGEGRYFIDPLGLEELKKNQQIVFSYGKSTGNPNGATDDIAGICSQNGKVLGMMPHPERAIDQLLGSEHGLKIWDAFLSTFL
jgi:phosphoribosylformylglycinamidine synthase